MTTLEFLKDQLQAQYDLGVSGVKVHLFKADIALNPRMTLADFAAIEADYNGYVATTKGVIAGGATEDAADNAIQMFAAFIARAAGGVPTPNEIYGYYLEGVAASSMAGKLIGAVKFREPIHVDDNTGWQIVPVVALGQPTDIDVTPE